MRYRTTALALSLLLGVPDAALAQDDSDVEVPAEPGDEGASESDVPKVDLSTPRSTVRSFLFTMQRATDDRPDLIDEAVRCLDVPWLPDDDKASSRARQLATHLFEVLASLDIPIESVPDESNRDSVTLWRSTTPPGLSVVLRRKGGEWRFSESTLEELDSIRSSITSTQATESSDSELQAQSDFKSPRATMATFLAAMHAEPPNLDRAADCLEPPIDPTPAWPVLRRDAAYRLYSVIIRVRAPVLSEIPEQTEEDQYTWFVHKDGRIVLSLIDRDDPETGIWRDEWRFSQSTLASLEGLYEEHATQPVLPGSIELGYSDRVSLGLRIQRAMPAALRVDALGLEIWEWLGIVCILLVALVAFALGFLGSRLLYAPVARARELETDTDTVRRMHRAFGFLVLFYVVYRAMATDTLLLPGGVLGFLYPLSRTMVLIAVAMVGLRLVQMFQDSATRRPQRNAAGLFLPLMESFFRLAIGAVLVVFVLRLLGFSQAAVLGSLGLVGAAVGFAARGSIANVVAAISIVYDRPFRVGDWVNFEGLDATVERLGLVSVRLRTFYNSLVVLPNSQVVAKAVDNYGERRYRRLRHFLRLRYDTPAAKIDSLCEGLRELVRLHPYTRKDYYHVYLNELTPSSADVLIYIFFDVPDWATELRERHRFLIDALSLVEKLGVGLAYPTQRLIVEEEVEGGPPARGSSSAPDLAGARGAKEVFTEAYGDPPKHRGPVVTPQSPLAAGFDDGGDGDGDNV